MPVEEVEAVHAPPADRRIWRYMDLPKYLSILHRDALYFPRVDRLQDPFEGAVSKRTIEYLEDHLGDRLADQESFERHLGSVRHAYRMLKYVAFVNSWHMSDRESAAMWELYRRGGEGIAVETTVGDLCESLEATNKSVVVGEVEYIDYQREKVPAGSFLAPLIYKRRSFQHEREVRAIHLDDQQPFLPLNAPPEVLQRRTPEGKYLSVDAARLINRVRVSPATGSWVLEIVASVTEKFGLGVPVEQSELDEEPLW